MGSPTVGHTPLRTCRVCRQQAPKTELQRWVVNNSSEVLIDPSGLQSGRGWYTCKRPECSLQATKAITGQARGLQARRQRQTKP